MDATQLHGVDVSWLQHSSKGTDHHIRSMAMAAQRWNVGAYTDAPHYRQTKPLERLYHPPSAKGCPSFYAPPRPEWAYTSRRCTNARSSPRYSSATYSYSFKYYSCAILTSISKSTKDTSQKTWITQPIEWRRQTDTSSVAGSREQDQPKKEFLDLQYQLQILLAKPAPSRGHTAKWRPTSTKRETALHRTCQGAGGIIHGKD